MRAPAILCLAALISPVGAYELAPYRIIDPQPSAEAVAVADMNGDGRDDLVVAIAMRIDAPRSGHVLVYLQGRDGTLQSPRAFDYAPTTHNTLALAVGDVSGDGRPDVVVGHDRGFTVFINRGFGGVRRQPLERRFIEMSWGLANLVKLHDVDGDGARDFIAGAYSGVVVYYNDGTGRVRETAPLAYDGTGYSDIELGDIDGDSFDDLVLTTASSHDVRVHLHDGVSAFRSDFETFATDHIFLASAALGDLDANGRDDMVVAVDDDVDAPLLLYRQQGGGLLAPEYIAALEWPGPIIVRDLDGDGRSDLAVLHNVDPALGVILQTENGLAPEEPYPVPYATWNRAHTLASGDLNGDGCMDVVIANYIEGPVVFDGMGCHPRPDLVPRISSSEGALRLVARNEGAAAAPIVTLDASLDIRSGGLSLDSMPAGCTLLHASDRAARMSCTTRLAANSETAFVIAVENDRNRLGMLKVDAVVNAIEDEAVTWNNRGSHQMVLLPRKTAKVALPLGKRGGGN